MTCLVSCPAPVIFEDVWWNFLFQVFSFFFLKKREWKFYEIRILPSESSFRENTAGEGSSAQCMQTTVGGFLLLRCKVLRLSFFWGFREHILKEEGWEEGKLPWERSLHISVHSVESMCGFFDLFGGKGEGFEGKLKIQIYRYLVSSMHILVTICMLFHILDTCRCITVASVLNFILRLLCLWSF